MVFTSRDVNFYKTLRSFYNWKYDTIDQGKSNISTGNIFRYRYLEILLLTKIFINHNGSKNLKK